MSRQRLGAVVALVGSAAAIAGAAVLAALDFLAGVAVVACIAVALAASWFALLRRGAWRIVGLAIGAAMVGAAIALLIAGGRLPELALIGLALALAVAGARAAFASHQPRPPAPAPRRPVLFMNPRSGGGKATRFALAENARARGIEPVELEPGSDLASLVRHAVAGGADALAMAGGDGSQAIVAAIAAEHDLPYACIPAGTRNHFALDLGVDRDDVVGALDALVDGGERRVDLAEVNGRVFVNNVSLGVYAEAVSHESYRDAKLRTVLETIPEALGPEGKGLDLRWRDRSGAERRSKTLILVSNNRYRLGRPVGSGTRPRMDEALLGIVEMRSPGEGGRTPWWEMSAPTFEVDADRAVAAGIDGEAVRLEPPLRFRIRPAALRVRIARAHPGASPSAGVPEDPVSVLRALFALAAGHRSTTSGSPKASMR